MRERPTGPKGPRARVEKLPTRTPQLARRLRRDATDAGQLLRRVLRDKSLGGFKFRQQKAFPPSVVDFYCAEKRLALEVDGGQHAAAVGHFRRTRLRGVAKTQLGFLMTGAAYNLLRISRLATAS